MCLTLGVNLLFSTTKIQLVLYFKCTVNVPVWGVKASMPVLVALFFLKSLYIYLIFIEVESQYFSMLDANR